MQAVSLTSYPCGVTNEDDAESPLGGRPVQSETALLKGRAAAMTEPQDLHAAHLMHVLEAHTTQLRHTDSILDAQLKHVISGPDTELRSVGSGFATQPSAEPLKWEGSELVTHSESQQGDDNKPVHLQGSLSGVTAPHSAFPQPIQASDVSTVQMSQAAQPILFPVMPMAAASAQAGSTVQPVLDSSLQLDISKPSHEAAGAGPAGAQQQVHSVQDSAVDSTSSLAGSLQGHTQQLPTSGLSDSFSLPNTQNSAYQGNLYSPAKAVLESGMHQLTLSLYTLLRLSIVEGDPAIASIYSGSSNTSRHLSLNNAHSFVLGLVCRAVDILCTPRLQQSCRWCFPFNTHQVLFDHV